MTIGNIFVTSCPKCKARVRYFPHSRKEWISGKQRCSSCGAWIVLSNPVIVGVIAVLLAGGLDVSSHYWGIGNDGIRLTIVVLVALILMLVIFKIFGKWRVAENKLEDSTEIRKSKRILISLGLLLIGVIIGVFGVFIFVFPHSQEFREIKEMVEIAPIEHLVYDIYKTGDYKSSVVALNCLIEKLEMYTKYATKSSNREMFTEDQALSHARLFLVYGKNGKQDLADQEYQKAVNLFGKEYGIKSKEQLKKIIERFDAIKVKP